MGWVCADERDDKIYPGTKHIVLRRPHAIGHKDELQLLQIYLESAWNTIGKAEACACPKTLAFGLIFGFISLAAMVFGLLGGLRVLKFISFVWGYVLFGAGVFCAVANAVICVLCRKREINKTLENTAQAVREIEAVYSSAAALTEEAAVTGGGK